MMISDAEDQTDRPAGRTGTGCGRPGRPRPGRARHHARLDLHSGLQPDFDPGVTLIPQTVHATGTPRWQLRDANGQPSGLGAGTITDATPSTPGSAAKTCWSRATEASCGAPEPSAGSTSPSARATELDHTVGPARKSPQECSTATPSPPCGPSALQGTCATGGITSSASCSPRSPSPLTEQGRSRCSPSAPSQAHLVLAEARRRRAWADLTRRGRGRGTQDGISAPTTRPQCVDAARPPTAAARQRRSTATGIPSSCGRLTVLPELGRETLACAFALHSAGSS